MKSAAVALLLAWTGWAAAEPVTLDGIAAYVDDAVITVGEVWDAVAPVQQQLRERYAGRDLEDKLRDAYQETLDGLIENKLSLKQFEAERVIDEEQLRRKVDRQVDEFIRDRFQGDRVAFQKALKAQRLTVEEWRKDLRERLIVGFMRNREVDSRVVISPRQVREIYESNAAKYQRPARIKIRMIVIHGAGDEKDLAARRQLAEETRKKVSEGADFADYARKVSEDGKGPSGGDWGWMAPADLRVELAQAASQLAPGGISPVIFADGEFYIFKVEDSQKAGPIPFEEARKDIERDLRKKEARRLYDAWIERLRKSAYIEIVKSNLP